MLYHRARILSSRFYANYLQARSIWLQLSEHIQRRSIGFDQPGAIIVISQILALSSFILSPLFSWSHLYLIATCLSFALIQFLFLIYDYYNLFYNFSVYQYNIWPLISLNNQILFFHDLFNYCRQHYFHYCAILVYGNRCDFHYFIHCNHNNLEMFLIPDLVMVFPRLIHSSIH